MTPLSRWRLQSIFYHLLSNKTLAGSAILALPSERLKAKNDTKTRQKNNRANGPKRGAASGLGGLRGRISLVVVQIVLEAGPVALFEVGIAGFLETAPHQRPDPGKQVVGQGGEQMVLEVRLHEGVAAHPGQEPVRDQIARGADLVRQPGSAGGGGFEAGMIENGQV